MKKPDDIIIEYEPCPACRGAGIRLIPPPVGGKRRSIGRTHGRPATYTAGCRCDLCRAGWREYAHIKKTRHHEKPPA